METKVIKSNKRKQYTSPTDPFERIYTRRRKSYTSSVRNLHARRVFPPAEVKGSIVEAKFDKKKDKAGVGFSDKGQKNSVMGTEGLCEVASQNTPPDNELFGRSEQNTGIDRVSEGLLKGERAKSGDVITHSRSKLFKNPSSFSYRRLLPYLMDLAKNNPNALGVNQCGTVANSVEEMPPPSLLVSQDGLIDSVNKDNGHPFNDSGAFPIGTSNEESSYLLFPEHPSRELPAQKPCEASTVSTVNGSMPTNLPLHLDCESVSQISQDTSNPAHDAPFVQPSLLTEGVGLDNDKVEFTVESCQGDEGLQLPPPHGGVSLKPEQGRIRHGALGRRLNNRSANDKDSCTGEGERDRRLSPKAKMGFLVPCSRSKLYKTPNSFSYRRLLPFLKDITENDSNSQESRPCQKVDEFLEEIPSFSLVASQTISKDGLNQEVLSKGHPLGSLDASPNLNPTEMTSSNVDCSNLESSEHPLAESPIQNSPQSSILSTFSSSMITNPSHTYQESGSQVHQGMLDGSKTTKPAHDAICIVQKTNHQLKSSSLVISTSVNEGATKDPNPLPEVVKDCFVHSPKSGTDFKSPEKLSLNREPFNIEPLSPIDKLACGPSMGILKRCPQGCRGICSCLKCASFRLHAERAFEFSRNQMQDAREVALELMKELSCIRSLLEKSVDGADGRAMVEVAQVKVACQKALRAEDLAKSRLREMNEELNIHCKAPCLQRPGVKFADPNEQELLSK
ncbi:hypothetical protein IFM89_023640 [Coptis chinensis]|uniref:Uncharacterized protein n=1 Tax=Coptis chinensis TaxID=261450 RepID=A0A835HSJ6_9MAGN|nr:hypothetical protein IFM89_023640 [Coptis chinensis]